MDSVVVAEVAMVAIFPNVASVGIEERVVTPAIGELDTGVVSLRHDGLGLKGWFQCDHQRSRAMSVKIVFVKKVERHVSASCSPQIAETSPKKALLRPTAPNR